MKRKISKIIFALLAPIACFLLIGIFSFSNISGFSSAVDYGGAVYVGNKSTLNMTSGTIRGFSANYGGGVYIASGGTFNLSGGSIYGNSSSYSAGKDIYNSGTFTMTGGTVGSSGTTVTSGIYNYGTMNLYGGSVYDDIYSPSQLTYTKMAVNISGTINLSTIGTITVQDYAGTTPTYKINLTTSRGLGAIVIFIGSSTAPDLSKLSISGYDDSKYMVATEKNSSGNWTVALKDKTIYFPSTWKTELESTDYMTTTVSERDISGIRFEKTVPSGYSQIGTLTTGIKVYRSTRTLHKLHLCIQAQYMRR